jgi:hypothetical protein
VADLVAGINNISSVGTLIGAAMETAGHYTQSQLLDAFEGEFGKKLAGLLYIIAIIGALITITSGASYRYGLYLLVGPPLYYFLITVRAESNGADWRFGAANYGTELRDAGIEGVAPPGGYKVSAVFKAWDRLVTDIIQGFIELTEITQDESNLNFINKTDRFINGLTTDTTDPKLIEFVNATLINHCQKYFFLKLKLADPDIPPTRKQAVRNELARIDGNNKIIQLRENHPGLQKWLQTILGEGQVGDAYTCDEAWKLGIDAFKKVSASTFSGYVHKIARFPDQTPAKDEARTDRSFGMTKGVPNAIADEQRFGLMINEIAARMLVKELSSVRPHLAALNLTDIGLPTNAASGLDYVQDTVRTMRVISTNDEYQYKGELMIGALTLPYIQGAILYFLAVTFPFFALMTVVPGRHTAVLLWASLWLWAKLWDLGFAVVMMIDNMAYALFPHGETMTDERVQDSALAMKIVFQTDPGYSSHIYYNLMACCLISIPFVCGFLVYKGGSDVLEGVQGTFRDFPSKFGTTMAAFQRSMQSQTFAMNVHKARIAKVQSSLWPGLSTDPVIRASIDFANRVAQIKAIVKTGGMAAQSDTLKKIVGDNQYLKAALGKLQDNVAGPVQDTILADLESQAEFQVNRATKKHLLNMSVLAYKQGKTREANMYAGLAIASNYNAHDFRNNNYAIPEKALQDYFFAERMTPNADGMMTPMHSPFNGLFRR